MDYKNTFVVWYQTLDYGRAALFGIISVFFLMFPMVFFGISMDVLLAVFCGAVGAKWLILAILSFDMASAIEKLESGDSENAETHN